MVDSDPNADLPGLSPAELESELRHVTKAIQIAGTPRGMVTAGTEAAAIRQVAALSARRRAIVAEIAYRRAALATWQADEEQFDTISGVDDPDPPAAR